jgi:CheY-like chemotaxis protein
VLIADDHENNRRFLSEALKPVGIEIFEARNGQEAIHIWNNHPLDLIWLDIAMPIMNGYEVVKHIRQAEAASNEHVVIIAMTASAFREDRATILDAGCDDYLLKPYMLSSMFEMLAKHLKMDYSSDDGLDEINTEIASKELRSVLKHLSEKERADLKESIEMLDYNATTTFINKIEKSYPHIAAVLMEKANQFDFEGLEKVFFS